MFIFVFVSCVLSCCNILSQRPRCQHALENAIEILHSEYEKVESLRAEIPLSGIGEDAEKERHNCKLSIDVKDMHM